MNKLDAIKRKIKYRSEYRGIKEMDLLLGSFVKKYINILIKNNNLSSKMGKEGRIIFKNKFSNDISFKKIISLYKK